LSVKFDKVGLALAVAARNLALGGNGASLSLLGRPRLLVDYASECLFLYNAMTTKGGLKRKNVFQVLPSPDAQTITLGNLVKSSWFFSTASYTADIVSLCMICQLLKPRTVFEIGTFRGYTALHFALNTPEDSVIYTLDLPKTVAVKPALRTTMTDDSFYHQLLNTQDYFFDGKTAAQKINCLYGDSATFDFTPFHGKVDFFFIDGSHSYEYVRSDTLNALKACHPGSVIAWHDFGRMGINGVTRWLEEFSASGQSVYAVPGGSLAFMLVDRHQ
jgi:Methyltransferase domain